MTRSFRRALLTRWRLVVKALPFVVLVGVAKVVTTELDVEDVALNPLYTGLVAGNVFLLGFLLAGTLADYKESEKLPSEVAAGLEAIADECLTIHQAKRAPVALACLEHLHSLSRSLRLWLHDQLPRASVLGGIRDLNGHFAEFDSLTQPGYVTRVKGEQAGLRRLVLRIDTIRETSFVSAGYLISELTSILLVGVLLFIDVGSLATDLVLLCTLTFLLVYMLLLIEDLDNPFSYGRRRGTAEVSLAPLNHVHDRLAEAIAGLD